MNLKGNLTSKGLQGSIGKSRMQGILGTNPAAIPISVDNALSLSSTNPVQNKVITAAITNRLWSDEVKAALLQIVEKVAYIDDQGQTYYDALYDALYPPVGLDSIGAVFDSSATIYNTDTLNDLRQYLTVTAYYSSGDSEVVDSYTLSGSMAAGTQTITVEYGGKTTTFTVTVVEWLTSISAVFSNPSIPVDISQSQIINAWIDSSTGEWNTSSTSTSICIPVTVGRKYSLNWSTTDSSLVGTILKWGFSDTNTPNSQVVTHYASTSPQSTQDNTTAVADKPYLVIQLGSAYISGILSNGYLAVTKLAGVITDADSLDTLRQYLVVTATYSDSTTAVITDYTLSGTLAEGTSTITASYGGKTDTVDVTVVHKLSLDDVAYGTLTYRDIFITNNECKIGNFEGSYTNDANFHTLSNGDQYKLKYQGTPTVSTLYSVSPTHSLKTFGTTACRAMYKREGNTTVMPGGTTLLIAANIYCTRYVQGNVGVIYNAPINSSVDKVGASLQEVTNGFGPVATLFETTNNVNNFCLYLGNYNSANADSYTDCVVLSAVPSTMTQEEAQTLYENYTAMILGGAT